MAAGGANRPGGPTPRDPELDALAAAHAVTSTDDGDLTDANSAPLYESLAEPGTYAEFVARSSLWGEAAGGGGNPTANEPASATIVTPLDEAWAESPDLLEYGIGGDGSSAVLIGRFAPLTEASLPAATAQFDRWVHALAEAGEIAPANHDASLDASAARYVDDPWDPALPSALGGTVAFSTLGYTSESIESAAPPAGGFLSARDLVGYNALRHPNAERYGVRWRIDGPESWSLDLIVVGPSPTPEQTPAVVDNARAGGLLDVNAARLDAGLAEIGWDPSAQAEAERIVAILAERGTIEESVRTDWEAWFFEDVLLTSSPYLGSDEIMEAVNATAEAPALGVAMAQSSNGLFYYAIVGR